jgi:hypothetical protein
MKSKIFKITAILLIFAGSVFSCGNEDDYNPLMNTKWKLVGIGSLDKIALQELEPKDCNGCYTIWFSTDSTFRGVSTNNVLMGSYKTDTETGAFCFINVVGTEVGEIGHGYIYVDILRKIQSFTINDTQPKTLHLYYNDGKNYLKYKERGD